MLYPLTLITVPDQYDNYVIQPGSLLAFPMNIATGQSRNIIGCHTAVPTQDYSLRMWVSTQPGGGPVWVKTGITYWCQLRIATHVVTAYDQALPLNPAYPQPLPLEPGDYYVNVLNLANELNTFTFILTDTVTLR